MIYFITDTRNIKIGYTKGKIEKRLQQLQTSCADNLYILGWIYGNIKMEKQLHVKFNSSKTRSNGEWFYPTEDLLEYINSNNQRNNTYVDFVDGKLMALLKIST